MSRKFDVSLLPEAPDLQLEKALWAQGVRCIAGIDEAGRGALAGPVVAAAVALPVDPKLGERLDGVHDSKQMTARQRTTWMEELKEIALGWGVGLASAQDIDAIGILPATRLAAMRALEQIELPIEHLLIDHLLLPEHPTPQSALTKGDARSLSIACASIIAKVTRDRYLEALDEEYPAYGFASHKGYGTASHLAALRQQGASPVHRHSFAPLRED